MFARVFNLSRFSTANMIVWFLMAFQAGVINAGGFIGCNRFVSHVTGFATTFGREFARGHVMAAIGTALVPIFFLLGTMISAYFVDRRIAAHKAPQYSFLVAMIVLLMLIAAAGGSLNWFGAFGSSDEIEPSYALLAILCLACGIQNASITSASGAVIRTTHLTGITTDLGIGLMRLFADGQEQSIRSVESRATIIRVGIIVAFIAGSTVGTFAFLQYKFAGYLIPATISGGLLLLDLRDRFFK